MRLTTSIIWSTLVFFSFMWSVVMLLVVYFFSAGFKAGSLRTGIRITEHNNLAGQSTMVEPRDKCNCTIRSDNPFSFAEGMLRNWYQSELYYCSRSISVVDRRFAMLHNVIIDPTLAHGRVGGEELTKVLNQTENREYWTFYPGAFRVLCPESKSGIQVQSFVKPFYNFKSYLNSQYLAATTTINEMDFAIYRSKGDFAKNQQLQGGAPVLAVTRYEYANLYHTVTYFYNIFLNAAFYKVNLENVTVLLTDGHPIGALDQAWTTLFPNTVRIGQLKGPQLVNQLLWVMMGYDSPMFTNHSNLPMLEEFREFVLSKHGISPIQESSPQQLQRQAAKDCTGSLVVIIWRRDYVAHPRNPKGLVVRKIANEDQVLLAAQKAFPALKLNVTGVTMESLTFREQLKLIQGARVLMGMHGAGLSHAMFLPKWSGLIELYPTYGLSKNWHFQSMTRWRGLVYQRWVNHVRRDELPGFRTVIPPRVVVELLGNVLRQLQCRLK